MRRTGRPEPDLAPRPAILLICEQLFGQASRVRTALVTEAVGKLSADRPASQADLRDRIDRVSIGGTAIQIRLSEVGEGDDSVKTLTLPWTAPSPYRRREIIQGASDATTGARPMRANARAILIEALGNAHRWLDELLSDPRQTLAACRT